MIAVKDPRISRLLPIWLDTYKDAQLAACAFICCLNPLKVAASLKQRNGIGRQKALLPWLTCTLEAEQATRGLPRAFVCFDTLLTDWRRTLAAAYDAVGIDELEDTGENATEIDGFLSLGRRHHKATTDQVLEDERLSQLLKDVWMAFRARPLASATHFHQLRQRPDDAWITLAPEGKLPKDFIVDRVSSITT